MIKGNKKDIIRPPKLAMPKTEAFRRIESQLKKGRKLFNAKFENEDDFKKIDLKVSKWHLFNKELLIRIFDSYEPAEEYEKHISWNHMRSREWAYRHSDIDTHRKFHLLYMQALNCCA